MSSFQLTLNGQVRTVDGVSAGTTLLEFLRGSGQTGTKRGCDEGDCGACTVALLGADASGRPTYRAINSCIAPVAMFAGRELVTVEGLCRPGEPLHPVQASMVDHYGSQCGYCTPGFTVSLFEAYYRRDCAGDRAIGDQLCGNLCRCTGYRPIVEAARAALAGRGPAGPADPFEARLALPVRAPESFEYVGPDGSFLRPTSLQSLFALWKDRPGARLVAGATEIGVERNKKGLVFPVLLSTEAIPELTAITARPDHWRIGGAAPLTAVEEALSGEYPSLAAMLRLFASRQIRNRATLGGNLATASPIGDSAPVLLTLDAQVAIAGETGERVVPLDGFFTGYRKTVLGPRELIAAILVPRGPGPGLTRRADFLKVSKRREMDISIVAGAFCLDCDAGGVVRRARLAYGGVSAQPGRARRAEAALEGATVEAAAARVGDLLLEEYRPIADVRGGADYRRGLIRSLWESFAAGGRSLEEGGVGADQRAGQGAEPGADPGAGAAPGRAAQGAGRGLGEADESRALRHESGVGHVTGRALYADDIAQRRPMLDVWPVMVPHARGRILRRNADRARGLPGVVAVLLAEDIPGQNNTGAARHDEPLLARDEVCFHGQVVALVVGTSVGACRAGAAAVEVEVEPLPAILTLAEAMAAGSMHAPPATLTRGDCAQALAVSPRVLEGTFESGGQEHFYLETQAAWAEAGEDGTILVCSSTQHPSEIQAIVAEVLGIPRNKVVTQTPRMGGGFGGKETQGNAYAALVALASRKTGRPVRLQLDRDVDMMLTGKRHPFHASFEVGFDEQGVLLACRADLVANAGWSLDLSLPVVGRALFHLDNAYYIPAVAFSGRAARTNVASNTAFRGFGGPQGMIVIEEILDRVARTLGLPPEVVRERNLYRGRGASNTTHYGQELEDNHLHECWRAVMDQAAFAQRRRTIRAWNAANARVKRGLAVTPAKFGISFTLTHYNQAGALVLLYQDGTAQVNHGGTEMGQGLHTKILGIAMRELGLPAAAVRIMVTSTDKVGNTSATAASAGADLNGAAVQAACRSLRERLAPVAAGLLEARHQRRAAPEALLFEDGRIGDGQVWLPYADVCQRAYHERISLGATGFYKTPGISWDAKTATGRPFAYFTYGAAVAEVEVDGATGLHRVRRVDIVQDVGRSLNPGVDLGQIEGAFVQGMGWLTREELRWDGAGRLLTHSASTYAIPAVGDAPMQWVVTLLPNVPHAGTIHGSKAVGEPPFMLAFCVREAIRDAVAAFAGEGGAVGPVPLACPATGEAIYAAIGAVRAAAVRT